MPRYSTHQMFNYFINCSITLEGDVQLTYSITNLHSTKQEKFVNSFNLTKQLNLS